MGEEEVERLSAPPMSFLNRLVASEYPVPDKEEDHGLAGLVPEPEEEEEGNEEGEDSLPEAAAG